MKDSKINLDLIFFGNLTNIYDYFKSSIDIDALVEGQIMDSEQVKSKNIFHHLAKEDLPTKNCLPIQYDLGFNYIEIETSFNPNLRLIMNKVNDIPKGYFVFDYFDSGEIFINEVLDTSILFAKPAFSSLMLQNFYSADDDCVFRKYPKQEEENIPVIPTISKAEQGIMYYGNPYRYKEDSVYSWIFPISDYFLVADWPAPDMNLETAIFSNIKKTVSLNSSISFDTPQEQRDIPLCQHFTFQMKNKEIDIISDNYKFANVVQNITMCSSPELTKNSSGMCYCPYGLSEQDACIGYAPAYKTVHTVSVELNNTNAKKDFAISTISTSLKNNIIQIQNKTDNVILNKFSVPSNIAIDVAVEESITVLNEYISCYTDSILHENVREESDETKTKESYILSIIGN